LLLNPTAPDKEVTGPKLRSEIEQALLELEKVDIER